MGLVLFWFSEVVPRLHGSWRRCFLLLLRRANDPGVDVHRILGLVLVVPIRVLVSPSAVFTEGVVIFTSAVVSSSDINWIGDVNVPFNIHRLEDRNGDRNMIRFRDVDDLMDVNRINMWHFHRFRDVHGSLVRHRLVNRQSFMAYVRFRYGYSKVLFHDFYLW